MKITMLASFSGDWTCKVGDVLEHPDDEAVRLIEAGFAIPYREAAPETATKKRPAAEKAAK